MQITARRNNQIDLVAWVLSMAVASPERGCWLWEGLVNNQGYPVTSVKGRRVPVTRVVMGVDSASRSIVVCHKCDNPLCIRPEHLFVGTQKDNIADCIKKKRKANPPIMRRGVHPNTKIRPEDIPALIARRDSGESTERIGLSIGCSGSIVRRAIRSVANATP